MGLRGPPPTPKKVLEARGSWRAKLNPNEPRPEPGAPPCPKGFTPAERGVWTRLCRTLADMGLLTTADWAQLERYCVMLVRWRACERFIAKHGLTAPVKSTDPTKYLERLPRPADAPKDAPDEYVVAYEEFAQVREAARLDKTLQRVEQNFGLTPSARTRLVAGGETGPRLHDAEADKAAKFFGGG